ncbi:MAG: ABC transporter permease [Chloroflexi bacterium]|nr:ABC transporter permease [Chloroflexota bacterium]
MFSVAQRVLSQLRHDPRFVALSLLMPVLIVYMLSLFFEGVDVPIFRPEQFVVPVGAFIVHFLTYALCALVLVRERTSGTLGRMFINGYRPVDVIGGYLIAYSGLALLQSLIVLTGLSLLFDLGYSLGTFAALVAIIWLLALLSITLGMLVSNFARSEGQVFPMIPLVIMFSVFFSGVILPIERLPAVIQPVQFITPMYYANSSIQSLIQPDAATADPAMGWIGLALYGIVLLTLARLTLQECSPIEQPDCWQSRTTPFIIPVHSSIREPERPSTCPTPKPSSSGWPWFSSAPPFPAHPWRRKSDCPVAAMPTSTEPSSRPTA